MSDISYYNEGVGHGAFVATFATAGAVALEGFNVDRPSSHIINVPQPRGNPGKWAGVAGFVTASATAQLPCNGVGDAVTPVLIQKGDSFTAPATHGGGVWIVTGSSEAYQLGDYWKANLQLQLKLN